MDPYESGPTCGHSDEWAQATQPTSDLGFKCERQIYLSGRGWLNDFNHGLLPVEASD